MFYYNNHYFVIDKIKNLHAFFISPTFIGNTRLGLAKSQAKAKQFPEAELFENYSLSSSMLSSKTNMRHSKKCAKSNCV